LLVDPELEGAADEETEVAETDGTVTLLGATVLAGAGALVVGAAGAEVGSPLLVYGQTTTALVTVTVVTTSGWV